MPTPAFKTLNVLDGAGATKAARVYDLAGDGSTGYLPSVATEDGLNVTQGAKGDGAATDSTSSWSFISLLKGLFSLLAGVLKVGGQKVTVSATFARPANTTAYTAGDIVSDNATTTTMMVFANFARVNAGSGYIVGARLMTDLKSITARFRVHLFSDNTATVSGDNLPGQTKFAEIAKRLGYFDLPAMITSADVANSTQSASMDMTIRFPFIAGAATRTIYAVLEVLDAFTPASGQNFTLVLMTDLD